MKEEWRITIHILPNGEVTTAVETRPGLPTSIHGMALFSRLEPEIDRFKTNVHRSLSAHIERPKRSSE